MAWQAEVETGSINRAGIARRERVTRARVTQILSLCDLPDDVKARLLAEDEQLRGMSIREALKEAKAATG